MVSSTTLAAAGVVLAVLAVAESAGAHGTMRGSGGSSGVSEAWLQQHLKEHGSGHEGGKGCHHAAMMMGHGSASDAGVNSDGTDMPCGSMAECQVIRALFMARSQVERNVTVVEDGYDATTTSKNATVASLLHQHIAMMEKRLQSGNTINGRDPLFAALFEHHANITVEFDTLDNGVVAHERGKTACAVDLTQEHAKVVSGFVTIGMPEMMQKHAVPASCPQTP